MKKVLLAWLILVALKSAMGQTKVMDPEEASITINCYSKRPILNPETVKRLTINCTMPNNTYAEILTELRITTLEMLTLNIEPSKFNSALNSSIFENLNVTKLVINYKFRNDSGKIDLIQMKSDVLYGLNEVKELEISGIAVVQDRVVGKENVGLTQCGLETLRISTSDLRHVPFGWLRHCDNLVSVRLSELRQRNATKEIRRNLLAGAVSLRKLEILNCYIEELEDEVADLVNLETLNVAHNQIHYALTTVTLPNLVELDLSYNHIFSSSLLSLGVEKQPRLRVLSVDFNIVLNICDSLAYKTSFEDAMPFNQNPLNLHSLQRFSLRGTITTQMCFSNLNMSSLEYFDLSFSGITALNFQALPMSKARYFEVNMFGCPIKDIPGSSFSEADYNQLQHEQLKISGLNITLECECDDYIWLAKASREAKLKLSGVVCANGRELWTVPEDKWQCSKYTCDKCACKTQWKDNSTDAECRSGDLTSIPYIPGLRRLNASSNLVENVTAADIPDSLIYLDLTKNHIARMSEEATQQLFNNTERRMRFYGNPIICDCENKPFILGLMDHFDKVEDYISLVCMNDGRLIRDVNPFELCFRSSKLFQTVLTSSLAALIGFVALIIGLYYRFGKAVKVYLYSKGLCLFCIREDEVDSDRQYDAFISFSHNDEDFVMKDLLPGLETEPYNYKCCVHYRNWIAGEMIPSQINQSIANSKRTIVVLSKTFLDSIWGLLEFRAAHLSSLKEGRTRLIIIILDDILETGNLDGELRTYLRTNTYVKWGDPWFWNKVRYALPHRSVNTVQVEINSEAYTLETDHDETATYENVEGTDVRTIHNGNEDEISRNATVKQNVEKDVRPKEHTTEQISDEEVDNTKDRIRDINQLIPVYQQRQISTDSAIEMGNYN